MIFYNSLPKIKYRKNRLSTQNRNLLLHYMVYHFDSGGGHFLAFIILIRIWFSSVEVHQSCCNWCRKVLLFVSHNRHTKSNNVQIIKQDFSHNLLWQIRKISSHINYNANIPHFEESVRLLKLGRGNEMVLVFFCYLLSSLIPSI